MTVKDAIKRAQNDARISSAEREHARPTVKDVFDLRKQGRIEEAYEAIRPMYAAHKGKYTTLCMFWTARDIFNKRMAEGRIEEAAKIYKALQRVFPNIDDTEGSATAFMQYAARALASIMPTGSPACPVLADSPACPVLADSVGEINPAPAVPTASPGEAHSPHSPHSPHLGTDVPPLPWGQKKVFDCIKTYPGLSVPRISTSTRIPTKSIERHIAALIDKKLIEHRGSKKTGGYYVL